MWLGVAVLAGFFIWLIVYSFFLVLSSKRPAVKKAENLKKASRDTRIL
jgi:hypothetical protein